MPSVSVCMCDGWRSDLNRPNFTDLVFGACTDFPEQDYGVLCGRKDRLRGIFQLLPGNILEKAVGLVAAMSHKREPFRRQASRS